MAAEALTEGDFGWESQLRGVILRGESLRAANQEAARLLAPRRPRALQQSDVDSVMEQFGVVTEQVLRDHAISHVLGALSRMKDADQLTFFGGTALARTFLPALRLSEDIDLITTGRRADMAGNIERAVEEGLRRSHGTMTWSPSLVTTGGSETAVLRLGDRIQIRLQLLSQDGYPDWPTQPQSLIQRYSDAPEATLTALTAPAFAANKTVVWLERRASRDLYDLWALGQAGYIERDAATLFERLGPTGSRPQSWMFDAAPSQEAWQESLDHQGLTRVTAVRALNEVKSMWCAAERSG